MRPRRFQQAHERLESIESPPPRANRGWRTSSRENRERNRTMKTIHSQRERRQASRWLGSLLLLLMVAIAPRQSAAQDPVTEYNVAEKLAQASTPADHQALAAYFRAEAAEAAAMVARHEKMLRSIQSNATGHPRGDHSGHCRALIKANQEEQAAFEGLAQEQDLAAKGAEK